MGEKSMAETIVCTNCGNQIEVSAALSAQLREHLRKEYEAEARRKESELANREKALRQEAQKVSELQLSLEQAVLDRLAQERDRLRQEEASKARESMGLELADLNAQLTETKTKLGHAQQAELQLRKERREVEEEKRALELTVNRRLDEERAKVREEAKREADEEHRLQEADKDKLVNDLRCQIDELKRKCEQGVPQAQGEVMELELEGILCQHFPADTIEPVPVGAHGGDVLQHVHDSAGQECGTILWESKRTKSWSDGWLPKLRNDQREARAYVAVLTTVEMPKGIMTFGSIDGVWITNQSCLVGLAAALRAGLLEVARTRRVLEGKHTKIEILYNYFSSPEFRQRIEGVVEAFVTMREDLDSEKRSMQRIWSKREKQLDRAEANTAGLYGDLGGILGTNLPQIANLELRSITACCQADEPEKAPWD
jgi:hypothetical protein